MLTSFLFVLSGLVLLTFGGEFLVRAASSVATSFGISPLVVGLTIVAVGTSAPELGVSLFAALQGNPEIALTNVVGSNIFNIGFILGLCALVTPLVVHLKLIRFDVPIMVGVSVLVYLFCRDKDLARAEGMVLLLTAVFYLYWLVRAARSEPQEVKDGVELEQNKTRYQTLGRNVFVIVSSLVVLVIGSRLLVRGAVDIAKILEVSDSLIGLTIVAAGTSLPEVATSLMATLRGQTDIAVGNVIGSNIMNLLLILGLSAGLNPGLGVSESMVSLDLLVMVAAAIVCYPLLVTSKKLVRWEGALLLLGYVGYTAFLIARG